MILIGIISILLLVTPLSATDKNNNTQNTQDTIFTNGESQASDNDTLDVYLTPEEYTEIMKHQYWFMQLMKTMKI